MTESTLTLATLIGALFDYRRTVGADTPIAIQYDGCGAYGGRAVQITAGWLETIDETTPLGAQDVPLYRIAVLGAHAAPRPGLTLALILRPVALDAAPVMDTAWPDALEVRRLDQVSRSVIAAIPRADVLAAASSDAHEDMQP